jgi:hypothetical protein
MSTSLIEVPSESQLRDHFLDYFDNRKLDLLAEYANLCISEEELGSRLQVSFGEDKRDFLVSQIIELSSRT